MSDDQLRYAVTRSYAGIVYSWAAFRELEDAIDAAEMRVGETRGLSMWIHDHETNRKVASIDWRHDQVVVEREDAPA